MNPDFLIRGVLGSVLGGGRKRSHRALRYLTGSRGSFLTRPQTLLTAAGVAWGIFETLQQQGGTSSGRAGGQGGGQWGGRVVSVVLDGSKKNVTVSGGTFASRFGLRSSWFAG